MREMRLLARGIGLVVGTVPLGAAIYVIAGMLGAFGPVLNIWLLKIVVDRAAAGAPPNEVALLAVLAALPLVLIAGKQWLTDPVRQRIEDRAAAVVDQRLMAAGLRLVDLHRIERPAFADELRLIRTVRGALPQLLPALQSIAGNAVQLGGLIFLLAGLHPLLPVALVALALPPLVAERRVQQQLQHSLEQHARTSGEMAYCARIVVDPSAAKEVRVYGLGDFFLRRYRDRADRVLRDRTGIRLRGLARNSLTATVRAAALAGGFAYVAAQAGAGRLTLGDLVLYLGAVRQLEQRTLFVLRRAPVVYQAVLRLRGLFAFLDGAAPAIELPPPADALPAPEAPRHGIEWRGVRFRYPEGDRDALEGVSALLPAGKVTALVGANGAGKSTLVKLLTRMYDPREGEILLDGVPLPEYDLDSLRRRIAVVYQDFARFALTFRENVSVGAWDLVGEDEAASRAEAAARWADADAIAARLPRGYDTELTRHFEGGVDLSGGEWQKVALARAHARDAAVLVLDEPTSALDADAEHRLFECFRELVAGNTALVISHRLSTVRMADHILVLEKGRIVESGSHTELIARAGRYATLFEMQASRYR